MLLTHPDASGAGRLPLSRDTLRLEVLLPSPFAVSPSPSIPPSRAIGILSPFLQLTNLPPCQLAN